MSIPIETLKDLQSPFYRVALKAIILDDQQRLLVVYNEDGEAELPGGGWEHGESVEQGMQRELEEEIGVRATNISAPLFVFQSTSDHGWKVVRIVMRADIESGKLRPESDAHGVGWVTKSEFPNVTFDQTDAPVQQYAHLIWN